MLQEQIIFYILGALTFFVIYSYTRKFRKDKEGYYRESYRRDMYKEIVGESLVMSVFWPFVSIFLAICGICVIVYKVVIGFRDLLVKQWMKEK